MARSQAIVCLALLATGCHDFDALVRTDDASDDAPDDAEIVMDAAAPRIKVTHIDDSDSLYTGTGDPFAGLKKGTYLLGTSEGVVDDVVIPAGTLCLFQLAPEVECTPVKGVHIEVEMQEQPGKGAPSIAVFHFGSVTIRSGVAIVLFGDHPSAFLVSNDVTISGTVRLDAGLSGAGAGGRDGQTQPCSTPDDSYRYVGVGECGNVTGPVQGAGSGGSNLGIGGKGGASIGVPTPTIGTEWSALLIGGGGGGAGIRIDDPDAEQQPNGGGGGGAFQITAAGSIVLEDSGNITGTGAGGRVPAAYYKEPIASGGGGGAGGTVFLEAPLIMLSGTIAVTGGGGGGADASATLFAGDGESGSKTRAVSKGGVGSSVSGKGGNGGSNDNRTGEDGGNDGNYGAGGGGAGGRIVLKAMTIEEENNPILVPSDCVQRPKLETIKD